MRRREVDSTSEMIRRMCKVPLFASREEELATARLAKQGCDKAKTRMIEANYRLVISLSKKATGQGVEHMDLIQEGCKGLRRAVEKFDPETGNKFSTYAYWWVRQSMRRAVLQYGRSVRLPIHVSEKVYAIKKFQESFCKENGKLPTMSQIAGHMDLPIAVAENIIRLSTQILSLDFTVDDSPSSFSLSSTLGTCDSTEEDLAVEHLRDQLQKRMRQLRPEEAQVISLSTGMPLDGADPLPVRNTTEIGSILGMTAPQVRKVKAMAMRKLRLVFNTRELRKDLLPCLQSI